MQIVDSSEDENDEFITEIVKKDEIWDEINNKKENIFDLEKNKYIYF